MQLTTRLEVRARMRTTTTRLLDGDVEVRVLFQTTVEAGEGGIFAFRDGVTKTIGTRLAAEQMARFSELEPPRS